MTETFDEHRDRVPGLLEVFVHAARAPDGENPMAAIWRDLRTRLAAVIAQLRTNGAVPEWVEPDAMAGLIVAVAAGTVVSVTVEPAGVSHRDIATQFAALLLAAGTARHVNRLRPQRLLGQDGGGGCVVVTPEPRRRGGA